MILSCVSLSHVLTMPEAPRGFAAGRSHRAGQLVTLAAANCSENGVLPKAVTFTVGFLYYFS